GSGDSSSICACSFEKCHRGTGLERSSTRPWARWTCRRSWTSSWSATSNSTRPSWTGWPERNSLRPEKCREAFSQAFVLGREVVRLGRDSDEAVASPHGHGRLDSKFLSDFGCKR